MAWSKAKKHVKHSPQTISQVKLFPLMSVFHVITKIQMKNKFTRNWLFTNYLHFLFWDLMSRSNAEENYLGRGQVCIRRALYCRFYCMSFYVFQILASKAPKEWPGTWTSHNVIHPLIHEMYIMLSMHFMPGFYIKTFLVIYSFCAKFRFRSSNTWAFVMNFVLSTLI